MMNKEIYKKSSARLISLSVRIWRSLFFREQWMIGIVRQPISYFLDAPKSFKVEWIGTPEEDGYMADPFGMKDGEDLAVFYEKFDYGTGRGTISYSKMGKNVIDESFDGVLDIPSHASYPYVFEYGGKRYCIPETQALGRVDLYEAENFPRKWKRKTTLIEGVAGVDPSIVFHQGKWWLFCTDENEGKNEKLRIFYADDLEGPWKRHAKDPVKIDARSSRSGGTFFEHEGSLYRPAQDCSREYGKRIRIQRIKKLSENEFEEEEAAIVGAQGYAGMHTLSDVGDMTLIDAKRYIFSWHILRHNILRHTRRVADLISKRSEKEEGKRKKVLVLGEDTRSFLAVIRSLGRKGLEVHVGWCPESSLALHSRYISKIQDILKYSPDDDAWKRSLIRILQKEKYDLVIPCTDQAIFPLQKNRKELEPHAPIYLLDDSVFEIVFNKIKINEIARRAGINLPQEMIIDGIGGTEKIRAAFDFPLVLKPESSFSEKDLEKRMSPKIIFDGKGLAEELPRMLSKSRVAVQEFFPGIGVGVEAIAEKGKILAAFQHERVHEPATGGASSYRKSVALDQRLLEASEKIIATLGYTGVAMFEFKIDPKSGRWIFVEMNSRFWGSLPLAVASGIDFPFYLYELLTGKKKDFPREYKKGIYARNLWQDANWLKNNLNADRKNPHLITRSFRQVLGEIGNIITLKEKSDTLVWDDPKPGVMEIWHLGRLFLDLAHKGSMAWVLSLGPVKKFYAGKILERKGSIRNILFVCMGNICRSPFAEVYAKKVLSGPVEILSAGYYPESGRPCPNEAVLAGNSFGIDLSGHRSRIVSAEDVEKADVIFVFDLENYAMMDAKFPEAGKKMEFLGTLGEEGGIIIKDPFGGSEDDFRDRYRSIAESIDNLHKKIR